MRHCPGSTRLTELQQELLSAAPCRCEPTLLSGKVAFHAEEKPTALPLLHTPSQLTPTCDHRASAHIPQERAREHRGQKEASARSTTATRGTDRTLCAHDQNEWTEAPGNQETGSPVRREARVRAHPSGSKPHYGAEATHSYMSNRSYQSRTEEETAKWGPLRSRGEKWGLHPPQARPETSRAAPAA